MSTPNDRLREHPEERFASPLHLFDLHAALKELRDEPHESQHGHRQITLYHHDLATLLLFSFDPGGELPDHKANGTVTIQALEGRLQVESGADTCDLTPGSILVLAPNVPHNVTAAEQSALLLTVCREPTTV